MKVAVLLSTYQGQQFLPPQLASLRAQSLANWVLFWRDDGSTDDTAVIMRDFAATLPPGQCVHVTAPDGRAGATRSYFALLDAAVASGATHIAFADQDDVWLADKLARAYAALAAVGPSVPALYCARQVLVDAELHRIGLSPRLHPPPPFPAALTQNIAVGCTMMLNAAAGRKVVESRKPLTTIHDWWCYIVVSAAGGQVLIDPAPALLYRQHRNNLIGAPGNPLLRARAALRRGPGTFMTLFRQHVAALAAQPAGLTPDALRDLARIEAGLRGGWRGRLRALLVRNLRRQTWYETLLFRIWFVISEAPAIHRRPTPIA